MLQTIPKRRRIAALLSASMIFAVITVIAIGGSVYGQRAFAAYAYFDVGGRLGMSIPDIEEDIERLTAEGYATVLPSGALAWERGEGARRAALLVFEPSCPEACAALVGLLDRLDATAVFVIDSHAPVDVPDTLCEAVHSKKAEICLRPSTASSSAVMAAAMHVEGGNVFHAIGSLSYANLALGLEHGISASSCILSTTAVNAAYVSSCGFQVIIEPLGNESRICTDNGVTTIRCVSRFASDRG